MRSKLMLLLITLSVFVLVGCRANESSSIGQKSENLTNESESRSESLVESNDEEETSHDDETSNKDETSNVDETSNEDETSDEARPSDEDKISDVKDVNDSLPIISLAVSTEYIKEILGEPDHYESQMGLSVYTYRGKNGKKSLFYFFDNQLDRVELKSDIALMAGDIQIGDPITKCFNTLGLPLNITDEGFKVYSQEHELYDYLRKENINSLTFEYNNQTLTFTFDIHNGSILYCDWLLSPRPEQVQIEANDLNLSPYNFMKKVGYPDSIFFNVNQMIILKYDSEVEIPFYDLGSQYYYTIVFMPGWLSPHGLVIGDIIGENVDLLFTNEEQEELGIDQTMTSVEINNKLMEHTTYSVSKVIDSKAVVSYSWDEQGFITRIEMNANIDIDQSKYTENLAIDLPSFDPNSIATREDIYLSGITFGSSRQDMLDTFGSPEEVTRGFNYYYSLNDIYEYGDTSAIFGSVEDLDDMTTGHLLSISTSNVNVIGPRGLRVGDPIENIMKVFPSNMDFDFENLTTSTFLYDSPTDPGTEKNAAKIYPDADRPYSGYVSLNVEWYMSISFDYEDGIITRIGLGQMMN